MKEIGQIIKGAEICMQAESDCNDCPYNETLGLACIDVLRCDVLASLKAREPVEQIRKVWGCGWLYLCGKCGNTIVTQQRFCEKCGQAVKWD